MEPQAGSEIQTRVEQLLRDAHIQRVRQQWAAAETLCRQALELAPKDVMGLEMLGDLLYEKGSLDEALERYRAALEEQPGKPSLEEKIGRCVLEKDREERDRVAAELLLTSPAAQRERKRGATITLLLSLLWPGLGQLLTGETLKGGLMAGGWLVSIPGLLELIRLMGSMAAPPERVGGARVVQHETNQFLAVLGFVGIAVYLYSLLDAAAQAGKPKKGGG